jgi:hypothetical protein
LGCAPPGVLSQAGGAIHIYFSGHRRSLCRTITWGTQTVTHNPCTHSQNLCTTENLCTTDSRMPKATPSKPELPKAPPKVRETKDAALFALRKAAYDAAVVKYKAEMEAYINAGQKEREQRKRKERGAASSAAAATSSSGAAETSSNTAAAVRPAPSLTWPPVDIPTDATLMARQMHSKWARTISETVDHSSSSTHRRRA